MNVEVIKLNLLVVTVKFTNRSVIVKCSVNMNAFDTKVSLEYLNKIYSIVHCYTGNLRITDEAFPLKMNHFHQSSTLFYCL